MTRNEWVTARLRQSILSGELAPEARLKAESLAEEWGVSPTPVRESLQRLASDGLVELAPGRGARVASLSLKEMVEIYSIRLMLEPFTLRLSLQRRTPEWEEDVKEALAQLRNELVAGSPDLYRFEEIHRAFHEALISRCNSAWLLRLHRTLSDLSVRYRLLSIGPRGGPAEVLEEHERLAASCLGDNISLAVARLFAHIRLTVDSLLPELGRDDSDEGEEIRRFRDALISGGRLLYDQEPLGAGSQPASDATDQTSEHRSRAEADGE